MSRLQHVTALCNVDLPCVRSKNDIRPMPQLPALAYLID